MELTGSQDPKDLVETMEPLVSWAHEAYLDLQVETLQKQSRTR